MENIVHVNCLQNVFFAISVLYCKMATFFLMLLSTNSDLGGRGVKRF